MKVQNIAHRMNAWLRRRQLRTLDEAYQGARHIHALEIQHFDGNAIAPTLNQKKVVVDYLLSLRDRQLLRIRANLADFRAKGFFLNYDNLNRADRDAGGETETSHIKADRAEADHTEAIEQREIFEKLDFIESILVKYRDTPPDEIGILKVDSAEHPRAEAISDIPDEPSQRSAQTAEESLHLKSAEPHALASKSQNNHRHSQNSTFFHRIKSIGQRDIRADEQKVVNAFRLRIQQRKLTIKWIAILIVIPILVQVLAKNFVFEPLLGSYSDKYPERIELSQDIQTEFYAEFTQYKESLEVGQLLGMIPELSQADMAADLQDKAVELWRESRERALNGIKNILADGTALVVFAGLVFVNRDRLATIRDFSNWSFLNLSNPIKVFILIFVTDIFVGFHSVEGWEVVLGGTFTHLGIPESDVFIKSFIATVPVFADSFIKLWIFSYLTRFSPSASAIYERMNT